MQHLFIVLLLLVAPTAQAHLSGFTDTSIQIAKPGIRIIYTLPADNLLELDLTKPTPSSTPKAPSHYQPLIEKGWQVFAKGRPCFLKQSSHKRLESITSYQYKLDFSCPQGMEQLDIHYQLFAEQWRGHQNYTRIFMAGNQQRMRFSFDVNRLQLSVNELLRQWNRRLDVEFATRDPNLALDMNQPMGMVVDIKSTSEKISAKPAAIGDTVAQWLRADPAFIWMGMTHMWQGLDHLLFLLALFLVPVPWQRMLLWVAMFTLAHSLTLALSYYGAFKLPAKVTEPLIALTIVIVGLENLIVYRSGLAEKHFLMRHRTLKILLFGLIHGIGLSYFLAANSEGQQNISRLLFFNLGVELGQLVLLSGFFIGLRLLRKLPVTQNRMQPTLVAHLMVTVVAGIWLFDRI